MIWNPELNRWQADHVDTIDAVIRVTHFSSLPNPALVAGGTIAHVADDRDPAKNGEHVSNGAAWVKRV